MELWDIFDKNGNKTGRTIQRGKAMGKGQYSLIVNTWITNKSGQLLITKRSPNKKVFPNMWETTCGAVIAGESSLEAALREVKEEININLSPANGKYLFRLKWQSNEFQHFVDVWLFNKEIDITEVIYQPEEVCGVKWASPSQILTMIETGEFTNSFAYLDEIFKLL
jgi:8-oxo-dGTP diphosphatase